MNVGVSVKAGALQTRQKRHEGSDLRDLRAENDTLRKELERKNARNDVISKELQSTRVALANQQREIRILSSLFEKTNADKQQFAEDLSRSNANVERLERQVLRLNDGQNLTDMVDKLQLETVALGEELAVSKSFISARDERIKSLERELEILHRSMEYQVQYEDGVKNSQQGREMMRSLYYELGKKKTENQALAVSLARMSQDMERSSAELLDALTSNEALQDELSVWKQQCESLMAQCTTDSNELVDLREKVGRQSEALTRTMQQIEDLSSRLSESRKTAEAESARSEKVISDLKNEVEATRLDLESLKSQNQGLQQAIEHIENVNKLLEQRSKTEWDKVVSEKLALKSKLDDLDKLQGMYSRLKDDYNDAVSARDDAQASVRQLRARHDEEMQALHGRLARLQVDLEEAQTQCIESSAQLNRVEEERNSAVGGLQQTFEGVRDLTAKLSRESQARLRAEEELAAAESTIRDLQGSKASVSAAMLDALQREKDRVIALENTIRDNALVQAAKEIQAAAAVASASSSPKHLSARNPVSPSPIHREFKSVATQWVPDSHGGTAARLNPDITREAPRESSAERPLDGLRQSSGADLLPKSSNSSTASPPDTQLLPHRSDSPTMLDQSRPHATKPVPSSLVEQQPQFVPLPARPMGASLSTSESADGSLQSHTQAATATATSIRFPAAYNFSSNQSSPEPVARPPPPLTVHQPHITDSPASSKPKPRSHAWNPPFDSFAEGTISPGSSISSSSASTAAAAAALRSSILSSIHQQNSVLSRMTPSGPSAGGTASRTIASQAPSRFPSSIPQPQQSELSDNMSDSGAGSRPTSIWSTPPQEFEKKSDHGSGRVSSSGQSKSRSSGSHRSVRDPQKDFSFSSSGSSSFPSLYDAEDVASTAVPGSAESRPRFSGQQHDDEPSNSQANRPKSAPSSSNPTDGNRSRDPRDVIADRESLQWMRTMRDMGSPEKTIRQAPTNMVEELKRLRDELRKVEEAAPSPLSQSQSQMSSFWHHRSANTSGFSGKVSHTGGESSAFGSTRRSDNGSSSRSSSVHDHTGSPFSDSEEPTAYTAPKKTRGAPNSSHSPARPAASTTSTPDSRRKTFLTVPPEDEDDDDDEEDDFDDNGSFGREHQLYYDENGDIIEDFDEREEW